MNELTRIAIIGCRNILPTDAFSLAESPAVDEIALLGVGNKVLARRVRNIVSKRCIQKAARVFAGRPEDAASARIAVIAAGYERQKAASDQAWIERNAETIRKCVRQIVDAGFNGILLVTTNPTDVMTHIAREEAGFFAGRVIGLPSDPIGRSETASAAVWCSGLTSSIQFMDDCDPNCLHFKAVAVLSKRSSVDEDEPRSLATCVKRVCEPVLRNERSVLPLSTLTAVPHADAREVYGSVRCVLGPDGVESVLKRESSPINKESLRQRAEAPSPFRKQSRKPRPREMPPATEGNMERPERSKMQTGCSGCAIKTPQFFCNFTDRARETFESLTITGSHAKGRNLFMQGQPGTGVYVLCKGQVKLSTYSKDGKSLILRIAEPGEALGLSAVVSDLAHKGMAEVVEDCQIAFIEKRSFLKFLRNHCEAGINASLQLSYNYHAAYKQVRLLGLTNSVAEKLARLFWGWANRTGTVRNQFSLRFAHQEIAEMIGTSRETVTRLLSDFRQKGLIAIRGRKVTIKEPEYFRSMADKHAG